MLTWLGSFSLHSQLNPKAILHLHHRSRTPILHASNAWACSPSRYIATSSANATFNTACLLACRRSSHSEPFDGPSYLFLGLRLLRPGHLFLQIAISLLQPPNSTERILVDKYPLMSPLESAPSRHLLRRMPSYVGPVLPRHPWFLINV